MFKSKKHLIGFDDRKLAILGIPLIALIISGILYGVVLVEDPQSFFSICFIIGLIYTVSFWIAYREIYFYLIGKYDKQNKNNSKRYMVLFPIAILLYLAIKLIIGLTIECYIFDEHDMLIGDKKPHNISEVLSSSIIIIMITSLYESSYLNNRLHKSIIERQELERQNIQSQLEGLRNKVNPHFLFNSLNTLCSIIPESPERGEYFVRQLSKVYRYILEIRDKKLISLKEELAYLDAYTFLISERFGDNIKINIDIDEKYYTMNMVPLSLQLLFENAIKHNIISKEKPLQVDVFIDEDEKLVVKNNLQKKRLVSSSTKFGLESIKERYKFFTDKTVEVISTTQNFIVLIPLVQTQNK